MHATQLPKRFAYLIFREAKRLPNWTPESLIFNVIYKVFARFGLNVFLGFFLGGGGFFSSFVWSTEGFFRVFVEGCFRVFATNGPSKKKQKKTSQVFF